MGYPGPEWSREYERAADGDQYPGRSGPGIESDYDDEHDANLDSATAAGTQFPAQVTVYDSLGEPHVATVTYEPEAAIANTWTYSVALPAADYSAAPGNAAPAPITGTLTFDRTAT